MSDYPADFEAWAKHNPWMQENKAEAYELWKRRRTVMKDKPNCPMKKTKKKKPKPKFNNKRKGRRKKKGWVDYEKYMKSAVWRKKSKKWREAEGKCEICGATENLQCHHKHYRTLGHETREDVQVVCYKCHCKLHNVEDFDKKK